jgi:hypothetical protein
LASRLAGDGQNCSPQADLGACYIPEMPFLARLEAYFEFQRLGTNWKTEILAGLTTFVTMA